MADKRESIPLNERSISGDLEFREPLINELPDKEMENSELSDKLGTVSVSTVAASRPFIFTYQDYLVRTEPINRNVIRKYSDFRWLQKVLSKEFPHHALTGLPRLSDRYQEAKVSMKVKYLNLFINKIVSSRTLKASKAVVAFLLEDSRDRFEQKKNELSKIRARKSIDFLQSTNSNTKRSDNNNIRYYNLTKKQLSNFNENLQRLSKKAKIVAEKSKDLFNSLVDFSSYCETLSDFDWVSDSLSAKSNEMFKDLSKMFKDIAIRQQNFTSYVENSLVYSINFTAYQAQPLRDLIDKNIKFWMKYVKTRNFNENAQMKGEILTHEQIAQYNILEKLHMCFNYKCRKHIDKRISDWINIFRAEIDDINLIIAQKPSDTTSKPMLLAEL